MSIAATEPGTKSNRKAHAVGPLAREVGKRCSLDEASTYGSLPHALHQSRRARNRIGGSCYPFATREPVGPVVAHVAAAANAAFFTTRQKRTTRSAKITIKFKQSVSRLIHISDNRVFVRGGVGAGLATNHAATIVVDDNMSDRRQTDGSSPIGFELGDLDETAPS